MTRVQEFDYNIDTLTTLLWQYNDAVNLEGLLAQKLGWYNLNHRDFWDDWYRDVFDLRTVNEFGATVWSIILDIPLVQEIGQSPGGYPFWGFGPALTGAENFDRGNFGTNSSSGVSLTLEQKRLILRLRYFRLTNKGNVTDINAFLKTIFSSSGPVFILDNLDMTIDYVFQFTLNASLEFVFREFDILPRPAGVKLNTVTSLRAVFGFDNTHLNFDNGNFVSETT